MENYRTFLVVFEDHKRVVNVKSSSDDIELCVKDVFSDILDSEQRFFLQVRDDGWKEFVDVPEPTSIPNNSVLRVVWLKKVLYILS